LNVIHSPRRQRQLSTGGSAATLAQGRLGSVPKRGLTSSDAWVRLAQEQDGIISRQQLLACGFSPAQARQRVETCHWRAVLPGVYATFTGPLAERARVWAALLYVGPPVCASHATALWLAAGLDRPPSLIHLSVPADRRVRPQKGLRIHLSRRFAAQQHPAAQLPRTRLEEAALDVADAEHDVERALDVVLRVTQRRLTTADRLRGALADRSRHRWRKLLREVLSDVEDGVASTLELRYERNVERRHGLPRGARNRPEFVAGRRTRYRDVRYVRWKTVVELDGRETHPDDERFRDLRRDNHAVVQGENVLRYGWRDVVGRPCEAALQVVTVLRLQGWRGTPRNCGDPGCPFP
jgi:hypothetical protein